MTSVPGETAPDAPATPREMSRRGFLGASTRRLAAGALAVGGFALVGGCDSGGRARRVTAVPRWVEPGGPVVAAVEAKRVAPGRTVIRRTLRAAPTRVDLGGRVVQTWSYDGTVPGPLIRATVGDVLALELNNDLPEHTTIHWHGIAIRNDMDGVHGVTQPAVLPGGRFEYRFAFDAPGTYWYHSHMGTQLDRGLYGPIVVDDPTALATADVEHVLVLDDWIDGFGATPDEIERLLHCDPRCKPSPFIRPFRSEALGGAAGQIAYPAHLINGRMVSDRPTLTAPAGARVRLRVINAGAETAYRFAVGGHRLTVTQSDGYPVEAVEVDTLLVGMGERFDVEFVVGSGAWPVVAVAEGKDATAAAVLRTTDTDVVTTPGPPPDARPVELDRQLLQYSQLRAVASVRLSARRPDRRFDVSLTGRDSTYRWGIDGDPYGRNGALAVRMGDRARIRVRNTTNHWHPMHLHGHTFRLGARADGPRKDTVITLPGETHEFDVECNNPGQWMLHCHNGYHFDAGMAIPFSYLR